MFLKSLEIRGFKSFADKTELKFKKGVTAVVGPNGSGKSNISDSVRWVLGEQSVKTLRGGKMEDVIFAGTQFRKPVSLAQVSLTLDNEDGGLSTEYNEVTVSRRIYRSGETEYLINGSKCRLKDITQLFMDTGIGKEGYSLIGQGKIEAVLSGKPEERRNLIEEAAGIVKYKSRKDEAEKKLENTDNNLVRIRDIISTYEERLEPLRIEREKALKYKSLADDLKEKEVSILVHYINDIEKELEKFNEDVSSKRKALEDKKLNLSNMKNKLLNLEKLVEDLEKKNEDNKKEYYSKKEEIVRIGNEVALQEERIKNATESINKNNLLLNELKNKISLLKNERDVLKEELNKSNKYAKEKEQEIISLEEEHKNKSFEIHKTEDEIKNLKEDEFELLRGHSEIKNAITLIEKDIKAKEEKSKELEESQNTYEGNMKINIATLEGLKEKTDINKSKVKTLEVGILDKKKKIATIHGAITRKENEVRELTKKINGFEANKNMLINLEKHYEGYNRTVKILMDRINKNEINFALGTKVVGEIFSVEKKYEVAVEIALGGAISNVITENDTIAKKLIQYLKVNNLGRATFLPLNNIRGNKLNVDKNIQAIDGFIGIASDVISYDIKFEKAINNILGRTVVCTDMDSALVISKKSNNSYRIVTLSGEIIAPGGAMTGGSIKAKNTNILGRKREIEELSKSLEEGKNNLIKATNELDSLKLNLKDIDEQILNDKDNIHFKNIEITKDESEIQSLRNEIEKFKHSLEVAKGEILRNASDIEKLNKSLNNKNYELSNIEGKNYSNKEKVTDLENKLNEYKESLDKLSKDLTEAKIKKVSLDESYKGKENEVKRKEEEISENNLRINNVLEEIEQNNQKITEYKNIITISDKKIQDFTSLIKTLEDSFKEDELEKSKLKDEIKIEDSKISELSDVINKEEGNLNKSEIQKAKSEMERDGYYTKLNEELELTFAEALEIAKEIGDISKCKEDISSLKRKITALGTVNLAAIEEYLEVKEKFEFMYTQEQDLIKAKEELQNVILEMTDKMKELFSENFKILNENFNETFKELFKGGSAELILAEGDELTANIDINVEPPGKKLQNINLMSGGEKVLSAIALMFAILKMKPTPFCILDEIEAALDDANVYRYAEFLKEFSKNTQFIVITHRKGTMEASDMMYGVTMQEKGVSKVVSVDLTKEAI